jgi:hypothetical protein
MIDMLVAIIGNPYSAEVLLDTKPAGHLGPETRP